MKKHKTIYLNIEKLSPTHLCWCEDKVNDSDIEYILKSQYTELEKQNEELMEYIIMDAKNKMIGSEIKSLPAYTILIIEKHTGKPIEEVLKGV